MTKDEFMRRADDAIYMNNLSLLQGDVDALFGELDRLRARASEDADRLHKAVAEVERLRAERDEARAHTSTAAFMRVERQRDEARADFANACDVGRRQEARAEKAERERDEALAQVARREREHEALLETAQKALAHVEAERDELKAKLDAELPAAWREDLASLNECLERAWRERNEARSLAERLRAEWQRDLDGCNAIIDRLKARLGER